MSVRVTVLGIDPGLASVGLALITDGQLVRSAAFTTSTDKIRGDRLRDIHDEVCAWLAPWRPRAVALEGYALGAKFNREAMGEVGGAIKMACARYSRDPAIWQVKSWQKTALGAGNLQKADIKLEVYKRYGVDLPTTHEVDAFGVAMAEYLALTGAPRPRPRPRKKVAA